MSRAIRLSLEEAAILKKQEDELQVQCASMVAVSFVSLGGIATVDGR